MTPAGQAERRFRQYAAVTFLAFAGLMLSRYFEQGFGPWQGAFGTATAVWWYIAYAQLLERDRLEGTHEDGSGRGGEQAG